MYSGIYKFRNTNLEYKFRSMVILPIASTPPIFLPPYFLLFFFNFTMT